MQSRQPIPAQNIVKAFRALCKAGLPCRHRQRMFDRRRHIREADAPGDEIIQRLFLGGVQDGTGSAATPIPAPPADTPPDSKAVMF